MHTLPRSHRGLDIPRRGSTACMAITCLVARGMSVQIDNVGAGKLRTARRPRSSVFMEYAYMNCESTPFPQPFSKRITWYPPDPERLHGSLQPLLEDLNLP